MVDQSDMWKNRQREQGATNPFGYTLEHQRKRAKTLLGGSQNEDRSHADRRRVKTTIVVTTVTKTLRLESDDTLGSLDGLNSKGQEDWPKILDTCTRLVEATQSAADSDTDIVLHSPTQLAEFHKSLTDGKSGRAAKILSFKCAWAAGGMMSAIDVIHLACILAKLTGVVRLELPLACEAKSVLAYDRTLYTETTPTHLPPSSLLDLFATLLPMPNLRVLDVTLELLVRLPAEVVRNVASLTVRIKQHEQRSACSALSWLFGPSLRSLRIIRSCVGPCPQESPARICASLDARGLTYLELRDIDETRTSRPGSMDEVAGTIEADDAQDKCPLLTTIVWQPCWSVRNGESSKLYRNHVREYLQDIIDVFYEGMVFLCHDANNALLLGCDFERAVRFAKTQVGDRWWEMDSWGDSWHELLQTVAESA